MPSSFAEIYLPILLQVILAMAVAGGLIGASALLGKRVRSRVKDMPYECGLLPTGGVRDPVSVKFYLVAMVFILFDIETVFLYPWAVVFRGLKLFAFLEMLVFVALILSGFFYIWKKGALDWSVEQVEDSGPPPWPVGEASAEAGSGARTVAGDAS